MEGGQEEPPASLPALQRRVEEYWARSEVVRRALAGPEEGPPFRFTEGPPTANGRPHQGHVVPRALKDAMLRYQRMRGRRIVTPMAGWDCHGLPVELEIEKRHGLKSRAEIEAYGVARFCEECRVGALEVASVWQEMSRRMGYWLDYDHPYRTMDAPYIESLWWALAELYRKGLLEKGYYCLPYCPRCGTSLSSHEVAQGYRETTDPSVTVRFPRKGADGEPPAYLLIWTTTPWTLPANLLVAARADLEYVAVRAADGSEYLLAEAARTRYFPEGTVDVVRRLPGRELAGAEYRPPFDLAGPGPGRYRVVLDDSVDPKEGTGFVHIAPSFGPEDQRIGERERVGFFDPLDARGVFTDVVPLVAGKRFKAADPVLLEALERAGLLFRSEKLRHTYPFCWRCDTPLLYRALDSWFVRTSRIASALVAKNAEVRWVPEHLRAGRFGNFLEEAKDWALSRSRYWGTPLPVWRCPKGHERCVGSFAELARLSARPLPDPFDPHRVTVDALALRCPECGEPMQREPYTIDAWFDSGAAPFAQYHYPFEPGPFDPARPLDYVAEGLDQTRGWFYTMLVLAVALFDRPAYRACLTSGLVLDDQGRKMSKSKGNAIDPLDLLAEQGGDAVRWAFFVMDFTEPMRVSEEGVRQSAQRTLGTLANVLAFYRENVRPASARGPGPEPRGLLDGWMEARTRAVAGEVSRAFESLDLRAGALALHGLVQDLSTWYLRRSRHRLWAEADTPDRRAAEATLEGTLRTLSLLLAPYAPFLAEAIYQTLAREGWQGAEGSVHLAPWPELPPANAELLEAMADLRGRVERARELRQRAAVKSRIPLPRLVVRLPAGAPIRRLGEEGVRLFRDELNVETLTYETPEAPGVYPAEEYLGRTEPSGEALFLSRRPTPALFAEGLVREAMRRLQSARKELGLAYRDRIELELWTEEPLLSALRAAEPRLREELLAEHPRIGAGNPPEGPPLLRWEFEGISLAARITRRDP